MGFPFKVCCMLSIEEADMAIAAGAQAIGLVGDMPNGPGVIAADLIREITNNTHAKHGHDIWTTLLTSRTDGEAIADHIAETGANTIQIVDVPAPGAHDVIRRKHSDIRIIQVIHVEDTQAIDEAVAIANDVDFILLDSGKPTAATRTLGGTGDTHDWEVSKKIVDTVTKPVLLAGGLNPENVQAAIKAVRPWGVDLCSGLRDREDDYKLVQSKLTAFEKALKAA